MKLQAAIGNGIGYLLILFAFLRRGRKQTTKATKGENLSRRLVGGGRRESSVLLPKKAIGREWDDGARQCMRLHDIIRRLQKALERPSWRGVLAKELANQLIGAGTSAVL